MVSSYDSYSVSVDSDDVQSVSSYSTSHSHSSSAYSRHNRDHHKLKHQQNSLPCFQQSLSGDNHSYPRQMSAPVKTSVKTREMHSASSAPLLDVAQDSDDGKAGSGSPPERRQQWWVGSRGSNDLLAIVEEEGNTRVRSFKRSQESLERQDSSSDSVDSKDSPKIKNGSVKRTLKSKIRSTLKGKSTLL